MFWMILLAVFTTTIIYLIICWYHQCKLNRMCFPKKNLDVFNLGSTYAYYDFEYNGLPIKGMNLANVPQYLDYDLVLLKKYIKYLKKNAKVLIVLPDFDFVAQQTSTDKKVYYEALWPWQIQGFSIRNMAIYIACAAAEPFTHKYEIQRNKWKGYVASYEEKEMHAKKRVSDWEKKLGVPNVKSDEITDELEKRICINLQRMYELIKLCNQKNVEPVIVIPPVSSIMREHISKKCIHKYLYEPINELIHNTDVRVFDYMHDKELESVELYLNSDCLNEEGSRILMRKIYEDIWR